ncbi:MAG: hypothetical protein Q7S08_03615 [bacterium]|nr:hypothetical protein [bacterium]
MSKNVSDIFFAFLYQKLLDNYGKFLPVSFFRDNDIPKDSVDFKIYIQILNLYIYTLKEIESRGRYFAIKLQERRLKKIIDIANKTKWWQDYFKKNKISIEEIKTLIDFQIIPPVNRFHLTDVPKEKLLTCPAGDNSIIWRRSGGSTTGTPFIWGHNKDLIYVNTAAEIIKAMINRGFLFEKFSTTDFYMQFNFPHRLAQSPFRWFMKVDFLLKSDDKDSDGKMQSLVQSMEHRGICVIRTSPNELNFLIGGLKRQNLHPPISYCLVVGGFLDESVRLLTAGYLGCEVIIHYGTQETGSLAMECNDHYGYYHVFSERVIIEILDDDGILLPDRTTGNITITCLDNFVMPLIRYQSGDIGDLRHDLSCTCENRSPLLRIKGRITDYIVFSNGNKKPAQVILKELDKEPLISLVRRFQMRQDFIDELKILLEIREPVSNEIIDKLKEGVLALCNNAALKIKVEQVHSIRQDGPKFQIFVPLQ